MNKIDFRKVNTEAYDTIKKYIKREEISYFKSTSRFAGSIA